MITNNDYKILAKQIAVLFCEDQQNKTLCESSVEERILSSFNDISFKYFLEHILRGRFYMLQLRNWHTGSNCRELWIDVYYKDVITGSETQSAWHYTAQDCGSKQYYYPDLNYLIRKSYTLIDPPITSKNNSDVTRPRLVYSPGAPSYNIVFVTQTPGGSPAPPKITIAPDPGGSVMPSAPQVKTTGGGIIEFLLSNPLLIAGGALGIYLIYKSTK